MDILSSLVMAKARLRRMQETMLTKILSSRWDRNLDMIQGNSIFESLLLMMRFLLLGALSSITMKKKLMVSGEAG